MTYPPQYGPNGPQQPYQPGPPPVPGYPPAPGGPPQAPPPFQGLPPQQGGVFAPPPPAPRKNKGPLVGCLGTVAVLVAVIAVKVVIGLAAGEAGKAIEAADDAKRTTNGEITDSGDLDPLKLKVGDCYHNAISSVDTTETVKSIDAIPCTQRHNAQVFGETTMSGPYPSTSRFVDKCSDRLKVWAQRHKAAGQALQQRDPNFSVSAFFPLISQWNPAVANRITCSVVSSTGDLGPKLPTL